jgi:hypothetical protein
MRVCKKATRSYLGIFKAMIYYEMDSDSSYILYNYFTILVS